MKKNNFKSLMQAAVLICTPLVIASCDDVFGDVDNPIPSYLTVSEAAVNLELHAAHPEKATFIRKANAATGAEVVYSSSDEKIATVDAAGKITAVNGGSCWIRVKATGMDSHGKMTYQEAIDSFAVNVKDWRAQIKFAEESAVVNSALIRRGDFKLKDSEVYPATGCTVEYTHKAATGSTDPIKATGGIDDDGNITLIADEGKAVITATISKVPDGYEMESFGDGKKVEAEFTLEVKEGVVYFAGYDATGKEVRKAMLKGEGADEYINLSDKLKPSGTIATTDVTLDAGWYYVDADLTAFAQNIRVKGDVSFILNDEHPLTLSKDLMDESAKQNFKVNFYSQRKSAANPEVGSAKFNLIKEFKALNVCGADINAPVNAVVDVTINNGKIGDLIGTGAGAVDITNATPSMGVGQVSKFKTVAINKGTAASSVSGIDHVTTVTISEGATVGSMHDITNLTVNKAASIGSLYDIETVVITETPIRNMSDITELTLNKVKTNYARTLSGIESVTINKTDGTAKFTSIGANALNISDGTIEVGTTGTTTSATDGQIAGFDKNGAADTKVTMTGGKLTVNGPEGAKFAILGDVEVTGGTFWACSPDHHAVSGALVGTFEGCTDGTTWEVITGAERPKYIRNKASE